MHELSVVLFVNSILVLVVVVVVVVVVAVVAVAVACLALSWRSVSWLAGRCWWGCERTAPRRATCASR